MSLLKEYEAFDSIIDIYEKEVGKPFDKEMTKMYTEELDIDSQFTEQEDLFETEEALIPNDEDYDIGYEDGAENAEWEKPLADVSNKSVAYQKGYKAGTNSVIEREKRRGGDSFTETVGIPDGSAIGDAVSTRSALGDPDGTVEKDELDVSKQGTSTNDSSKTNTNAPGTAIGTTPSDAKNAVPGIMTEENINEMKILVQGYKSLLTEAVEQLTKEHIQALQEELEDYINEGWKGGALGTAIGAAIPVPGGAFVGGLIGDTLGGNEEEEEEETNEGIIADIAQNTIKAGKDIVGKAYDDRAASPKENKAFANEEFLVEDFIANTFEEDFAFEEDEDYLEFLTGLKQRYQNTKSKKLDQKIGLEKSKQANAVKQAELDKVKAGSPPSFGDKLKNKLGSKIAGSKSASQTEIPKKGFDSKKAMDVAKNVMKGFESKEAEVKAEAKMLAEQLLKKK